MSVTGLDPALPVREGWRPPKPCPDCGHAVELGIHATATSILFEVRDATV